MAESGSPAPDSVPFLNCAAFIKAVEEGLLEEHCNIWNCTDKIIISKINFKRVQAEEELNAVFMRT